MVLQIAEYLRKLSRKERGFTLIELVIVVAIIAILIAVAIPIYQNVTRSAAQRSHDTNLRSIDSAVSQYFMETGTYPTDIDHLLGIKVEGSELKSIKLMEEKPAIPDLLIQSDKWSAEEKKGYYLKESTAGDPPWAAPAGWWEGGYRTTYTSN